MIMGLRSTKSRKKGSAPRSGGKSAERVRGWIRFILFWSAFFVLSSVGANIFWDRFGSQIVQIARFQLTPESLDLGEYPPWIHHDIRPELLLIAFPGKGGDILSRDVLAKIALAAESHPWVRKVGDVRKFYPSRLSVTVVWRQPVAMVRVPEGLLPIDANGVLLPSRDFTPVEAAQYPRIVGDYPMPSGPAGHSWGDGRVCQAASLAELIYPDWKRFGFRQIELASRADDSGGNYEFIIVTHSGSRILWGHAPSVAVVREASPEEKTQRLHAYYREHGSFDGIEGPQEIDVRPLEGLRVRPLR
ncbi:MAG: cell division protein FtsQ/DivIB [Thermogutta sp.]